jgi:hypothetical protein
MQRRRLLGLGIASGALLALAGVGAVLMHEAAWHNGQLLPKGRTVLRAVARGVLDGSLPTDALQQAAALDAHLSRIEALIDAMPPHTQVELADLLAVLAMAPVRATFVSLGNAWDKATVRELHAALQSMRQSSLLVRRQAYSALRDLTHAAFFSDASTWRLLNYPGPRSLA